MNRRIKTEGFTLVEIAIALVIIGLLLGGILKGQDLLTSARVRDLIAQQDGIKAAYLGFEERFRARPGDFGQATSLIANASQNGNSNGQIESSATPNEAILVWEHLSRAGFLNATYTYAAVESAMTSPLNRYGVFLQLVYDGIYGAGTVANPAPARDNLKSGAQIPVEILAEVDRKMDDGAPNSGSFQFSRYRGNGNTSPSDGSPSAPSCSSSTGLNSIWNTTNGSTNCGAASLL